MPDVRGLRPTGDRIRETLFNWLQAEVAGARVLDLFAGSGALGFEALSRYAQSVIFIEPDANAHQNLLTSGQQLAVSSSDVFKLSGLDFSQIIDVRGEGHPDVHFLREAALDALQYWRKLDTMPAFDLVFIDPPFEQACQWQMLAELAAGFLSYNALIYIEFPSEQLPPEELPAGCELVREKTFGDVSVWLVRHTSDDKKSDL